MGYVNSQSVVTVLKYLLPSCFKLEVGFLAAPECKWKHRVLSDFLLISGMFTWKINKVIGQYDKSMSYLFTVCSSHGEQSYSVHRLFLWIGGLFEVLLWTIKIS